MVNWNQIKHFKLKEWGNWKKVNPALIYLMDEFRKFINKPIIIHVAYEERPNSNSQHPLGNAVDFHVVGIHPLDVYLLAERFPFTGLGIYGKDVWNNPGLHADIRKSIPARWGCIKDKDKRKYVALDKIFIEKLLNIS